MKKKSVKLSFSVKNYFLGIKYLYANAQCLSFVYTKYQNVPEKMWKEFNVDAYEDEEREKNMLRSKSCDFVKNNFKASKFSKQMLDVSTLCVQRII